MLKTLLDPHWNLGKPFVLPSPRRGMLLTSPPNATVERLTSDSERCRRSTARRSRRRICAMSTICAARLLVVQPPPFAAGAARRRRDATTPAAAVAAPPVTGQPCDPGARDISEPVCIVGGMFKSSPATTAGVPPLSIVLADTPSEKRHWRISPLAYPM